MLVVSSFVKPSAKVTNWETDPFLHGSVHLWLEGVNFDVTLKHDRERQCPSCPLCIIIVKLGRIVMIIISK